MSTPPHFILVSFPVHGHLNPNLHLSNRLICHGAKVTFLTSSSTRLSTTNNKPLQGLTFVEYDDGFIDEFKTGEEMTQIVERMKHVSSEAIRQVVSSASKHGCSVTCILYSLLIPWVAVVARELHVPSAFVWIQSAATFNVYYYYNHGYDHVLSELEDKGPSAIYEFPGLFIDFKRRDFPEHIFSEQMAVLDAESSPARVLVNTFDSLEPSVLKSINAYKLTAIGPLVRSDVGYVKNVKNTDFSIEWLNSKADSSVVYVSFGTVSTLPNHQIEQIGRGLLEFGKPFIWVIKQFDQKPENEPINCIEQLNQLGLIVPWCNQLKILSHSAIACFITHCGWNSTIESMINGVPMIGFPQMFDQFTNAKLIEDCFEIGVRVSCNSEGLVESDEIKRCLEVVIGDEKLKRNVEKWKKVAVEAVKEGGSSDKNLKDFVNSFVKDWNCS